MSDLLTDAQGKFIELSKRYEALKEEMKQIKPQLHELLGEIGIDNMFQDPETKLVYKVIKPTGTFISFDEIGYNRTKKAEEKKGTLSKKEAQEAGYEL